MSNVENKAVFAQNLRRYIKQSGKTQKQLAQIVDVAQSTFNDWCTGKKYPRMDKVEILANYFSIQKSDLIEEKSADGNAAASAFVGLPNILPISRQRIPLLGGIHAGEPTFATQDFESYVEVGTTVRCDFALRVVGDSMTGARIQDGDIVFIRQQDTVQEGEIAAVLIDDETTLKRVRYLPGGMVMLCPENSSYSPIIIGGPDETRNVKILGKAVAFQSDVK